MKQKYKITFSMDYYVEGSNNEEALDKAEDIFWDQQIEEMQSKGESAVLMFNSEVEKVDVDKEVKELG